MGTTVFEGSAFQVILFSIFYYLGRRILKKFVDLAELIGIVKVMGIPEYYVWDSGDFVGWNIRNWLNLIAPTPHHAPGDI